MRCDGPGNAFPFGMSDRDAIWRFAEHVAETGYEDLAEPAAAATRGFLLDTLGVGVAGSATTDSSVAPSGAAMSKMTESGCRARDLRAS